MNQANGNDETDAGSKKYFITKGINPMKTMKKIVSIVLVCILCMSVAAFSSLAANYIGEEKAKEVALTAAGVSAADAKFMTCKFDYENGVAVYEVEFYFGSTEYSYDINAKTGAVLKAEIDKNGVNVPDPDAAYIGKAKAKEIAFATAGVKEADAKKVKVKFEFDDGVAKYEVDFHSAKYDYEYDIDALNGSILKAEKDRDFDFSDLFFANLFEKLFAAIKALFNK